MSTLLFLILVGLSTVYAECIEENDALDPNWDNILKSFEIGNMEFGLELFRNLNSDSKNDSTNLFYSPLSIWSALSSLYIGARGQTAKELENVLGLDFTKKFFLPKLFDKFLEICHQCGDNENASFKMANRIYIDKKVELKLCEDVLKNIVKKIDFSENPKISGEEINKWVEGKTNGKIHDVIPASAVTSETQMVVINAIYFKEHWKTQFNPEMTRNSRFYMNRDTIYRVDMMNTHGTFIYGVSEEMKCQALEIPYSGDELSMLLLLPQHPYNGFDNLVKTITGSRLKNLINSMSHRELWVTIPKFKVEQEFELSNVLQKMGLRSMFNPVFTDLSGFTGKKDLTVDAVYHKSYIKVNEEGTEAAVTTSILLSRVARPGGITRFVADRPFLYLIRHVQSNVILFMGTVKSPEY
ncbi:leukocyte elastase inhibitor-like [Centruroides sculpturatus]|uniref:leukocyte elastase inhibitor-like n=1 Tax=Centruroides sculpturatus TaxID=218467 RepID=UPI000C6CAB8C|nr:leukocyte elastase inhibitor-like [Centruroides sculpturatus]